MRNVCAALLFVSICFYSSISHSLIYGSCDNIKQAADRYCGVGVYWGYDLVPYYNSTGYGYDVLCILPEWSQAGGGYFSGPSCGVNLGNRMPNAHNNDSDDPVNQCGSIVQIDNQAVGEQLPIVGTDYYLSYFSSRVQGRVGDYILEIPLSDPVPDPSLTSVRVTIAYSGRTETYNYPIAPNIVHRFVWDGKDASGQSIPGATEAIVTVTEFSGTSVVQTYSIPFQIGRWKSRLVGLGGWEISPRHYYDPMLRRLFYGDGTSKNVNAKSVIINSDSTLGLPFIPRQGTTAYFVADDNGKEGYLFSYNGLHLETRSTLTGAVLLKFAYNAQKELVSITDAYDNVTQINRSNNSQIQIVSPYGQVTTLNLDSGGWTQSIVDPKGRTYYVNYLSDGIIQSFIRPDGKTNNFSFDPLGLLLSDSSNSGQSLSISRTDNRSTNSKTLQVTTAEGRRTSYNIVGTGDRFTRTETLPTGVSRMIFYQPGGSTQILENGQMVTESSNFETRLASKIPGSLNISGGPNVFQSTHTRTVSYDTDDYLNLKSQTDRFNINGAIWTVNYSGENLKSEHISPMGRRSETKFDPLGKVIETIQPGTIPIAIQYDDRGRLKQINQGGRFSHFQYNPEGFVGSITNALNETTNFEYDDAGQVIRQTLPDGRTIAFSYDSVGNLTEIHTAKSTIHTMTYTLFDTLASYLPPLVGDVPHVTTYGYNRDRQLIQIIRPDQSQTNFNYNATTGVLASVVTPEGAYEHGYLSDGKRLRQIKNPAGDTLTYSWMGEWVMGIQDLRVGVGNSNLTLDYDKLRIKTRHLRGPADVSPRNISYAYDLDGLLTQAGDLQISRNLSTGAIDSTHIGNVTETFLRDSQFGELSQHTAQYDSQVVFDQIFERDGLGRIIKKNETINGVSTSYDYIYDSAGRLMEVAKNGTTYSRYTYDANSNRISSVISGQSRSGTYDDQDRLISYGPNTYSYNANGELINKTVASQTSDTISCGAINVFQSVASRLTRLPNVQRVLSNVTNSIAEQLDCEFTPALVMNLSYYTSGQLRSAQVNEKLINYNVDGHNRRSGVTINGALQSIYVYGENGSSIIAELDSAGNVKKEFVYGTQSHVPDYMIAGGVSYRFITDQLGSVRVVINTVTGEVAQQMDYDEFGVVTNDTSPGFQPFGFAGGLYDKDTGLVRFGARDYDPEVGRWTSKDPILFGGGDPNLYGYAMNDPVNFIDPEGLTPHPFPQPEKPPYPPAKECELIEQWGGICIPVGKEPIRYPPPRPEKPKPPGWNLPDVGKLPTGGQCEQSN